MIVITKIKTVLFCALIVPLLSSATNINKPTIIKKGDRKAVYQYDGMPGQQVCFKIKDLDGAAARGHLYREADPGNRWRDLNTHTGEHCLSTIGDEYFVHVEAPDSDIRVYVYEHGLKKI